MEVIVRQRCHVCFSCFLSPVHRHFAPTYSLTHHIFAATAYNTVDVFDVSSGLWTTAALSVARGALAAASVGSFAIFAGGYDSQGNILNSVDLWNATSGLWSTSSLSVARYWLAATSVGDLALFAGGLTTDQVSSALNCSVKVEGAWWIACDNCV
jgi:hypothetical protein